MILLAVAVVGLLVCNVALVAYVMRRPLGVVPSSDEPPYDVEAEVDDDLAEQMWLMSGEFPISDLPYGVDGSV